MLTFQLCIRTGQKRQNRYDLAAYASKTIGGDHERWYGAPFVKILCLTDLAQKLLSLRIYSYLCADLAISAQI